MEQRTLWEEGALPVPPRGWRRRSLRRARAVLVVVRQDGAPPRDPRPRPRETRHAGRGACELGYQLFATLGPKERRFLSRIPEARRRGIDIDRCCREGDVLCMKDPLGHVVGFTARTHFPAFCYVHSAIFRDGYGDALYRETLRLAVQHSVAVFLTLDANHPSCLAGRRSGAHTTNLLELDNLAPDFVERIRDFPPGGYYRDGNRLRSVHDAPDDITLLFKVTAVSFEGATGELVLTERMLAVA